MEASQTFKDKRSRLTKEQRERVTPELVEEIMEKEKAFFQDWLKNAMFSEKTVKTYQAYPAKIETTEAADIHVKIDEPIQVKQTFLRRVYYHLPVKVQNKVKPIVKNYFKKKAQQ